MSFWTPPFGQPRPPRRPDRQVQCRKRRRCEGGICGLMIEPGDRMWILRATDNRLCNDCYEVRQDERS